MKKPLELHPGSAIHLQARVSFSPSIPLKISVEQCYGTSLEQLGRARRVLIVVNSYGSVRGGGGTAAPGTLRSCKTSWWERMPKGWRQPGIVSVLLSCPRCLHGQKLVNVSVHHQPGESSLQLTILAPVLGDDGEEEVRLG